VQVRAAKWKLNWRELSFLFNGQPPAPFALALVVLGAPLGSSNRHLEPFGAIWLLYCQRATRREKNVPKSSSWPAGMAKEKTEKRREEKRRDLFFSLLFG